MLDKPDVSIEYLSSSVLYLYDKLSTLTVRLSVFQNLSFFFMFD